MKQLNKYLNQRFKLSQSENILEKLKINSKSKINTNNIEILEPKDFDNRFKHNGFDYNGDSIIIIGKPFKDKNDKNYKESKEFIKKNGLMIYNDLEDILWDAPDSEYYIYACSRDDIEVDCYVYGTDGAYVIK